MNLRKILAGGFLAIIVGVVLRILLPIPIFTTFAVLLFFFLLQIIEARFGTGLAIGERWLNKGVKTAVAFVAFIALRFLTGQVLGIYPVAARNEWGPDGGVIGLFWGNQPYPVIVHELVLVIIIGWILWGYTRGQRMAKLAAFMLAVVILLGVLFPVWAGSWPKSREAIDKSLATKGISGTLPALKTSGSDPPLANSVCEEAFENPSINNHGDSDQPFTARISDGCWGATVTLPSSWKSDWCYQPTPKDDPGADWRIAFQFIYGGVASRPLGPFHPMDKPYFGHHPMSFRIQGHGVVRFFQGLCAP